MMELISLGLSLAGITVPIGTVLVRRAYATEQRMTILETNYANVEKKLAALQDGQTTLNAKLDRLIERFL